MASPPLEAFDRWGHSSQVQKQVPASHRRLPKAHYLSKFSSSVANANSRLLRSCIDAQLTCKGHGCVAAIVLLAIAIPSTFVLIAVSYAAFFIRRKRASTTVGVRA